VPEFCAASAEVKGTATPRASTAALAIFHLIVRLSFRLAVSPTVILPAVRRPADAPGRRALARGPAGLPTRNIAARVDRVTQM
jgi:hypothetical protein